MKKFLMLSMTAMFAFSSMAFAAEKRGFIEKANNKVEIKNDKKWKTAKSGEKVFLGDSIRTGLKSTVEIKYDDETRTRVGSRSHIVITDRKIDIKKGYIWGKVDKRKTKGLKIVTSNAVASIVGTEFFVEVGDKESSTITVLEGEISVTPNKKDATKKIAVKAGDFATFDKDGNVTASGPLEKDKVLAKFDEVVNFDAKDAIKEEEKK
ncbi:MAG: FecR family protein [Candidatus Sericytochromatia bacterium]